MEKRTFRVYFRDGNQKLFETDTIYRVILYLRFELHTDPTEITKIEEVEG